VTAFENCIARNRLKPIEPDPEMMAGELAKATEELERARSGYLARKYRDSVTQAYFAMLRSARAGLNARGYRDTNLYGLCIGIEELWVETGDLGKNVIDQLRKAKDVKDSAYNGYPISQEQAKALLVWSQDLGREIFGRLALPGFDAEAIPTGLPVPPDHEQSSFGNKPPNGNKPLNGNRRDNYNRY
jgi:uncharacterized protein (UPF0332 family)